MTTESSAIWPPGITSHGRATHSKHVTFSHCWLNVGTASWTVDQHWTNNGSMSRDCCAVPIFSYKYDMSQASDWSRYQSRPIRSLRYIVTCTRENTGPVEICVRISTDDKLNYRINAQKQDISSGDILLLARSKISPLEISCFWALIR